MYDRTHSVAPAGNPRPDISPTPEEGVGADPARTPLAGVSASMLQSLRAQAQDFNRLPPQMSLEEYFQRVTEAPQLFLRNEHHYLADALRALGTEPVEIWGRKMESFAAANWPWDPLAGDGGIRLVGQEQVLSRIESILRAQARQEHGNKLLLLHGPWGCGKTLVAKTLLFAAQDYSQHHPEGQQAMLTFEFPERERYQNSRLGFHLTDAAGAQKTEDGIIIPAAFRTNPFFLLSNRRGANGEPSPREAAFNRICDAHPELPELRASFRNSVLSSQLDRSSELIIAALMEHYRNDWDAVVANHLRVRPFSLCVNGKGGLTMLTDIDTSSRGRPQFPASDSERAYFVPLQLGRQAADIPLFTGPFPDSARGLLYFDNLLGGKTGPRDLEPLQEAIEGGLITVRDHRDRVISAQHRAVLLASAGDPHLRRIVGNEDWDSLRSRMVPITVGHRCRWHDEARILDEQIQTLLPQGVQTDPHVVKIAAIFMAMTRMRAPQSSNYIGESDQSFKSAIDAVFGKGSKLSAEQQILLKTLLLSPGYDLHVALGDTFKASDAHHRVLNRQVAKLADEFSGTQDQPKFAGYDGAFGISERAGIEFITHAVSARAERHFLVTDLLTYLEREAESGFDYLADANRQVQDYDSPPLDKDEVHASLGDPSSLIDTLSDCAKRLVRHDLIEGLGTVTVEQLRHEFRWYIENVKAYLKNENIQPGDYGPQRIVRHPCAPDEKFMRTYIEELLDIHESRKDEFRRQVLNHIAARSLERGSALPDLGAVFQDGFPSLFWRVFKYHLFTDIQGQKGGGRSPSWAIDAFLEDCRIYIGAPTALRQGLESVDPTIKTRAQRFHSALQHLTKIGYPEESIPKLFGWAFTADGTPEVTPYLQYPSKNVRR